MIWFVRARTAAEAFDLPLMPPSANKGTNFSQGANFAVMGATALDLKYFKDNNVWSIPPFNTSMSVQLQWFDEVKQTVCSSPQGKAVRPFSSSSAASAAGVTSVLSSPLFIEN